MNTRNTFEKVYEVTSQPLIKFISKKLRKDQHVVDDIFQETMLAAYKGWNTFQHKSKYLTWLCRIALNKIADYYRRNIHEGSRIVIPLLEDVDALLDSKLTPEEYTALQELRSQVKECLALLPSEYRRLIELRYFKHYSYQKIAEIIGTTERGIEGKLYRAKRVLKEILTEKGIELSRLGINK